MSSIHLKHILHARTAGRCSECGVANRLHFARYGRGLHIHRIVPGSAYTADGCKLLCMVCHHKAHGGIGVPTRLHSKYRRPRAKHVDASELDVWIHEDALQALERICEDHRLSLSMGLDLAIALLEAEAEKIQEPP